MNVGRKRPSRDELANSKEYKRTGKYSFHGHLVSLGSRPRWQGVKYGRRNRQTGEFDESQDKLTGKKLKYVGVMPANDAFRRASEAAAPSAVAQVEMVVRREIEREAAKAR